MVAEVSPRFSEYLGTCSIWTQIFLLRWLQCSLFKNLNGRGHQPFIFSLLIAAQCKYVEESIKLLVLQYNKQRVCVWVLFSISLSKPQAIPECFTKSNYVFMDFGKIRLMYSPASAAFITVIVLVCLLNSYKYDTSFITCSSFGVS